jgi:hypothetical protein
MYVLNSSLLVFHYPAKQVPPYPGAPAAVVILVGGVGVVWSAAWQCVGQLTV